MDPSSASKPSNQARRAGVRVVGKIRPFLDSEIGGASGKPQFSITRLDGEHALVGLSDQNTSRKDSYKLDWCYDQNENADEVFSREVKPLVEGLFRGRNACVIAYGARGSGKSQLIQGSEENPGLALMALSEILAFGNEMGGVVTVSCYEVSQDHVYDLLEPKEQEVLVLEDAARRIQLKGLSQVPINSISDLEKLSLNWCNPGKGYQRLPDDGAVRNHTGLIVYLSYVDKESNKSLVGKINFVSLADYEDSKQKSNGKPQLAEGSKINKSLYTLLNIVHALNVGENYIPYRESKLTRLLQEFLCRKSMAVLITCLNPIPCQDTISTVNLASRSCHVANQHRFHSAKMTKSASRIRQSFTSSAVGSHRLLVSVKKNESPHCASTEKKGYGSPSVTKRRPEKLGSAVKTTGTCLFRSNENKSKGFPFALKERNLFSGASPLIKSENLKVESRLNFSEAIESCRETLQDDVGLDSSDADHSTSVQGSSESVTPNCKEYDASEGDNCQTNEDSIIQDSFAGTVFEEKLTTDTIDGAKDDNHKFLVNEQQQSSPPISEKLREISNSLKLLSTQTNSVETPMKEQKDPKTPGVPLSMRLGNESTFEYMATPQDILKTRSAGLKKSLVQDCLAFLNSAKKEDLMRLKGIGEKRATYILQLREESPEPFKNVDDLRDIGFSTKQINSMMSHVLGDFLV